MDRAFLRSESNVRALGGSMPDEFLCALCNRQQTDPRVLPCFHSFCLSCLQDYQNESSLGSHGDLSTGSGSSTGYESEAVESIRCPSCSYVGKISPGGLSCLPVNFILQHKILLTTLNQEEVAFLCDLCSNDIPALARCSDCLVNLCRACLDIHGKQSKSHQVVPLPSAAGNISSVRRQIMCYSHPDKELTLFCSDCQKVICASCCTVVHRGHACDGVEKASKTLSFRLRERLDRLKIVQKEARHSTEILNSMAQRVEIKCAQVEEEIDKFVEDYIQALHEHRKMLRSAVADARTTKLNVISHCKDVITESAVQSQTPMVFGEDLLADGSPTELLVFAGSLTSRLDTILKPITRNNLPDMKALETINFLTEEKANPVMNKQLYGVVTTQRVWAPYCSIHPDGLLDLNNARQQQLSEVLLITRDTDEQPMCHGGEEISAQVSYRDLTRRCIPVLVKDNQDGTYTISFTPDAAGNMSLAVSIRGSPINGSPLPVCVRTLRPHHGTFHCCSFCSSGGKKQASCGCGGTMPGGYKGCGHGHLGHPGRRHWSCCGNTLQNSECGKLPPPISYLTL